MQIIKLTRGLEAKIDDEDLDKVLTQGKWQALKGWNTWYGRTDHNDNTYLLHRFVLGIHTDWYPTERVDHIDKDGLNCQKENLRVVSVSINAHNRVGNIASNTSGVNGVWWNVQKGKWSVEIRWNKKRYYCGSYDNIQDAKKARLAKERDLWAEYHANIDSGKE